MAKARLSLALLILLSLNNVFAETPEEKGLAIMVEADARDTGWVDQLADLKMTLKNKQGQSSTRELETKTLEIDGDGDKSMTLFHSPKDIKGTAFLSFTHALEPDEQWLFLPALKRVKRISSANKSGPFVGSEFAYEDLSSQEIEKYSYKWLRDEPMHGHDCFVVETYPEYDKSGYTKRVVWLDKEMYQARKIDFYDRKNTLLKTLEMKDYEQYLDKYWRPGLMHMVNHQSGKETELSWENYRFSNGFTDRDFDKNSLKRSR